MRKLILISLLLTSLSFQLFASEKKNHAALFLGASSGIYEHGHTNFAIGIDYTRRILTTEPNLGLGLFAEFVAAEHPEIIVGLPLSFYPTEHIKLSLAPAMINFEEQNIDPLIKDQDIQSLPWEKHTQFFVRLGLNYDFHIKNFSVGPALSMDIVNGNLFLVYGLNAGISF